MWFVITKSKFNCVCVCNLLLSYIFDKLTHCNWCKYSWDSAKSVGDPEQYASIPCNMEYWEGKKKEKESKLGKIFPAVSVYTVHI